MLPILLFQLKNSISLSKNAFKALSIVIICLACLFPYAVASIPFLIYFHPSRTQWLKDNGFKGIDWDEIVQNGLFYTLIGIIGIFVILMLILTIKEHFCAKKVVE